MKIAFLILISLILFTSCSQKELAILADNIIKDIDRANNGISNKNKAKIEKEKIVTTNSLLTKYEMEYSRPLKLDYFEDSKWNGFIYEYHNSKAYFIELNIGKVEEKTNLNQLTNIKIFDSIEKKKLLGQCNNATFSLPVQDLFMIEENIDKCTDWDNEAFKIAFERKSLESNMINGAIIDSKLSKKAEIILQRESKYLLGDKKVYKKPYSNPNTKNENYIKSNNSNIFISLNTNENLALTDFGMIEFDENRLLVNDGKEIKVWDINENKIINKLLVQIGKQNIGTFSSMALSPNKKYLAVSGVFDGPLGYDFASIHIFDLEKGIIVKTFKMNQIESNAKSLEFTKDGKYLLGMTVSGELNVWNMNKMEFLKSIFFYENQNQNLTDNFKIKEVKNDYEIYISYQNKLKVYSLFTGELKKEFISPVIIKDFDINNKNIIIVGAAKKVDKELYNNQVFILNDNLKIKKILVYGKTSPIIFSEFNSSENKLILSSANAIYLYSINEDYKLLNKYEKDISSLAILKIDILSNDKLSFYNAYTNKINVFDINTFKVLKEVGNKITSKMFVSIKDDNIGFTRLDTNLLQKYKIQSEVPINYIFNLNTRQISSNNINLNKKTHTSENLVFEQINNNSTNVYEKSFFNNKLLGKIDKTMDTDNIVFYKDFIIRGTYGEIQVLNKYGYKIASLEGQNGLIGDLAMDGDKLISASDVNLSVWDLSRIQNFVQFKNIHELDELTYKILKESKLKLGIKNKDFIIEEYYNKLIENNYFELAYKLLNVKIVNPLLNVIITNDDEWVMWTPEGYFDSSENGYKYIGFHINQGYDKEAKWVGIEKLYDHFYRPDLVKLALQGDDIKPYTKGLSYLDVLKNPAPEIKITKVDNKTINSNAIAYKKDEINLEFDVSQVDNGGVGIIRIYQEGKLVNTIGEGKINRETANVVDDLETQKLTLKAQKSQEEYLSKFENSVTKSMNGTINDDELIKDVDITQTIDNSGIHKISLPLKAGENKIEIEAFNKSNTVASIREKFTVDAKIKNRKPTIYAIIAGVNEFEDNKRFSNLKYSENDAKAIGKILQTKVNEKVVSTLLLGKDFTKENLFRAINDIKSKAKLEDKLIFYVSTHGKVFKGDLHVVPQNNKYAKDFIKFEDMFKEIQSISALDQIFVIDACESGKAKDIVSSVYDSKASVLAKQSGVHVLLATAKGTFAFEHPNPNIKHGVFTNNILDALNSKKTDENNDRKISIIELSKVLKNPEFTTEYQYPIIRNVGQDTKVRDLN